MQRSFRIATYNIHKGRGIDGRVRIERIVRVLQEIDADIVALQEVINRHDRSPRRASGGLSGRTRSAMPSRSARRASIAGRHGNVTLSRWTIEIVAPHRPERARAGSRAARCAPTSASGDRPPARVQRAPGNGRRERRAQARLIDERLLKVLDVSGQRIVMGDFNDWNHGLVTRTLSEEFHLTDLAEHVPRTRAYPGRAAAAAPGSHLSRSSPEDREGAVSPQPPVADRVRSSPAGRGCRAQGQSLRRSAGRGVRDRAQTTATLTVVDWRQRLEQAVPLLAAPFPIQS